MRIMTHKSAKALKWVCIKAAFYSKGLFFPHCKSFDLQVRIAGFRLLNIVWTIKKRYRRGVFVSVLSTTRQMMWICSSPMVSSSLSFLKKAEIESFFFILWRLMMRFCAPWSALCALQILESGHPQQFIWHFISTIWQRCGILILVMVSGLNPSFVSVLFTTPPVSIYYQYFAWNCGIKVFY